MNIYKKLSEVRVELQGSKLHKSGENKFAKFKYFELDDLLPTINRLNKDKGLVTIFNIKDDIAKLTIIDADSEAKIEFEVPTAEANMKGMQEIQKLGSQITYMRRYLLFIAYEITEKDTVDAIDNTKIEEQKKEVKPLAQSKIKALYTLASKKGYDSEGVKNIIKKKYKIDSTKELTLEQFTIMIKGFEGMKDKEE